MWMNNDKVQVWAFHINVTLLFVELLISVITSRPKQKAFRHYPSLLSAATRSPIGVLAHMCIFADCQIPSESK